MTDKSPPSLWRALSNRNFALYFAGQGVSLIGTWLQQTAMTWLVYRLTQSAWLLGVVGFAGQLPSFLLAPLAGVWTDRWNRHRALIVTQVLAMLQAFLLAYLSWSGTVQTWHIIALSAFLGCVSSVDITVRQAFVVDMVSAEGDLANAIGLNSTLTNGTRLLGPALAGVLIPLVGEPTCFLLNALSYGAVIAALVAMTIQQRERPSKHRAMTTEIWEGFRYAYEVTPIRAMVVLVSVVSFAGLPYTILLPAWVSSVLHGEAGALGFLMAISGVGATASGIYLASRRTVRGLQRHIVVGAISFGAGLIALAGCQTLLVGSLAMMLIGYGMMLQFGASNTVIQVLVDPDKRGRVMSIYLMAFFGTMPLGSLAAGALADRAGAAVTIGAGGALCVLAGLLFIPQLASIGAAVTKELAARESVS